MQVASFHLGTPSKPTSVTYKALCTFKDALETLDPSIRVEISPSKQGQEISALVATTLDIAPVSMADIRGIVQDRTFELLSSPFLFTNSAHLARVYDGPIGKEVFERIWTQAHIKVLTPLYIGNRVISLKDARSVTGPNDLASVRLRVPVGDSWLSVAKTLGATPVPLPIDKIADAYKEGAIDGHENPISACCAYDLLPFSKQIIKTDHLVDCVFLTMSRRWETLSPTQQRAIKIAAHIARKFNDEERRREELRLLELHKSMISIPDLTLFRASSCVQDPLLEQIKQACHPAIVEEHRLWPGLGQGNCKPGQLLQTAGGDILACWYGGGEIPASKAGSEDTKLWLARYSQGVWTKPECVYAKTGYHIWNPVFLESRSGRLALFFRKFMPVAQERSTAPREFSHEVMFSTDGGLHWTEPQSLPQNVTCPTKCAPLVLSDGSWVIPSSRSDGTLSQSYLELSSDEGASWECIGSISHPDHAINVTEPCLIPEASGTIKIFLRNRQKDDLTRFILSATYNPLTRELSAAEPTNIPNPDSGIDGIRLKDGRMMMVANPTSRKRTPLSLLVSTDEGKSWNVALHLQEGKGSFAQPAILQANDGRVHVLYSWWSEEKGEKNIKHVVVDLKQL